MRCLRAMTRPASRCALSTTLTMTRSSRLSKEELRVLMNIQQGKMPDVSIDPHEDLVDWYSNTVDPHPMQNRP